MAVRSALRSGRPIAPWKFLVPISVRGWVDSRAIVRLEELSHLKNPMTSSGIKPATSGLYYSTSTNYATACLCTLLITSLYNQAHFWKYTLQHWRRRQHVTILEPTAVRRTLLFMEWCRAFALVLQSKWSNCIRSGRQMEQWGIGGIIVEGKPMYPESDLRQVHSDCKPPELCHDQVRRFVTIYFI
jgi:hypothetical protein